MKEIQLTKGQFAQVDDEDFEQLNKIRWQANKKPHTFYAVSTIRDSSGKRKYIKMHRVIMNVYGSSVLIDHKDSNGLNNQKLNLRVANTSQNMVNRNKKPGSTSKYFGVSWFKPKSKWRAYIDYNNKSYFLGYFKYENDAALVYNIAAIKYHGDFAKTNIIDPAVELESEIQAHLWEIERLQKLIDNLTK